MDSATLGPLLRGSNGSGLVVVRNNPTIPAKEKPSLRVIRKGITNGVPFFACVVHPMVSER